MLVVLLAAASLPSLRPRTRYALIFVGVAKFLVPGALLAPLAGSAALHGLELPSFRMTVLVPGAGAPAESEALCILFAFWAAGTVAIAGHIIARQQQSRKIVRDAAPAAERESATARRIAGRAPFRLARLARSAATIPMTAGLLRGVVLLPESCIDDLDEDELTAVLAHEITHVERRHNLAAAVQDVAVALFWFHPLLWIARRRLDAEAEKDCDEQVLHFVPDPPTYLSGMLKVSYGSIAARPAGVSCMSTFQLKERMDHLMKYQQSEARSIPHRLAIAFGIVAVAAITAFVSAGEASSAPNAPVAASASDEKEVTPPKLLTRVNPSYPKSAREKGVQGLVVIDTSIDKQGNVTAASVLRGIEGDEGQLLAEAAVAAVKQWKWEPAQKNGRTVATTYTVTINFKLSEK